MKLKKCSYVNWTKIAISFVFLFNPNITFIDILPDFIGYIILCNALVPLADISDSVYEALSAFKKMIYVDLCKIIAFVWVFGFADGAERTSSLLLWSFAFGVLEMIFLIPSFVKLFKGLLDLGYFYENTSVIGAKKQGSRNYTDKIRLFTVFFVCAKAILSFLPEFMELSNSTETVGANNLYRYIGLMRAMAFIPALIIGIAWAIRITAYFKRIKNDTEFVNALNKIYEERVLVRKGIFAKRHFAVSGVLIAISAIFSFDLRIGEVIISEVERESFNILPDFISAVVLMAFFVYMYKWLGTSQKLPIFICGAYVICTACAYVIEWNYFTEFTHDAIYRSVEALNAYWIVAASSVICTLLFAVLCCYVIKCLNKVIHIHTGTITDSSSANSVAIEKMNEDARKELGRYLKYCIASVVFYSLTDIFYVAFSAEFKFTMLVSLVGVIVLISVFAKAYFDIAEAIKSRYILE